MVGPRENVIIDIIRKVRSFLVGAFLFSPCWHGVAIGWHSVGIHTLMSNYHSSTAPIYFKVHPADTRQDAYYDINSSGESVKIKGVRIRFAWRSRDVDDRTGCLGLRP